MEELRARHTEIDMLNRQIGTVYGLAITVLSGVTAVIGLREADPTSDFTSLFLLSEINRAAALVGSMVFLSLMLLKNNLNMRMANQARYVREVLRPRLADVARTEAEYLLSYEDAAASWRKEFFSRYQVIRALIFENMIIVIPFLATIIFCLLGAFLDRSWGEFSGYAAMFLVGLFVWSNTGRFWRFLDRKLPE